MQLIDEEFESATEKNVTTAFCKLAKLVGDADEAKRAEITSTRSFQTLVGVVLCSLIVFGSDRGLGCLLMHGNLTTCLPISALDRQAQAYHGPPVPSRQRCNSHEPFAISCHADMVLLGARR